MHKTLEQISAATKRERLLFSLVHGGDMEPGDQLSAIVDTARALQSAAIPFALIGGIAVGIRSGVPRATDDVDIAVATTASRALVTEVLENGGLALRREFEHSLNFRHSNSEPVQIAFDPDFDAMIERSKPIYVQGLEVPVVLIEDLIEMKQRAAQAPGRRRSKALRDRADVELLKGDAPDPDEGW